MSANLPQQTFQLNLSIQRWAWWWQCSYNCHLRNDLITRIKSFGNIWKAHFVLSKLFLWNPIQINLSICQLNIVIAINGSYESNSFTVNLSFGSLCKHLVRKAYASIMNQHQPSHWYLSQIIFCVNGFLFLYKLIEHLVCLVTVWQTLQDTTQFWANTSKCILLMTIYCICIHQLIYTSINKV